MAITIANSILKCVRIGNEQSEWIERNDINFSKFVRKLVDAEISSRESKTSPVGEIGDIPECEE